MIDPFNQSLKIYTGHNFIKLAEIGFKISIFNGLKFIEYLSLFVAIQKNKSKLSSFFLASYHPMNVYFWFWSEEIKDGGDECG